MIVKLYQLLLRRKDLKVRSGLMEQIENLRGIYDPQVSRKMIRDSEKDGAIEQIDIVVPLLRKDEVEAERNWYSHQWRLCDGAIQQANHTLRVPVQAIVMQDYTAASVEGDNVVTETLASLLTRRKTLEQKATEALRGIDVSAFTKKVSERRGPMEGIKDLIESIPAVPAYTALAKQLWYVKALRFCEEAIQRTNANTELEVEDSIFHDFVVR